MGMGGGGAGERERKGKNKRMNKRERQIERETARQRHRAKAKYEDGMDGEGGYSNEKGTSRIRRGSVKKQYKECMEKGGGGGVQIASKLPTL
jgi:hypothetical protein